MPSVVCFLVALSARGVLANALSGLLKRLLQRTTERRLCEEWMCHSLKKANAVAGAETYMCKSVMVRDEISPIFLASSTERFRSKLTAAAKPVPDVQL